MVSPYVAAQHPWAAALKLSHYFLTSFQAVADLAALI